MATEITVSNLSQLQAALVTANGGETIRLEDGDYGSLTITKDFTSTVKIEAINQKGATFTDIDVPGGSHIHFDGLTIDDQPRVDNNAHHITFSNSMLKNGLYFRDAEDIVVHNNDIGNSLNVLTLNSVKNFEITENYLHDARSDIVRITGDSKFGLFENNTLVDIAAVRPMHPDFVQMFGTSAGNPTDITFRGNHFHDDSKTGDVYGQGFFLSDPTNGGYKNILIEDNLINIGSPNAIYINGGQENVVVINNTLVPWPGDGGAMIQIVDKSGLDNRGTVVYNNIAKLIAEEPNSNADVGSNYIYGRNADLDKLFSGGDGGGEIWQDFIPVKGSPIDLSTGLGASARILELLGGGSDESNSSSSPPPALEEPNTGNETVQDAPPPAPTPTPVPTPPSAPVVIDETPIKWPDVVDIADNMLVAFSMIGDYQFNRSASDVVETAHNDKLFLDAATVAMTFNADSTSGKYGLISKDAAYYSGGGNHLVSYIENGTLVVRFQDGAQDEIATITGIKANTDYDLQINFGDGNVAVWLDNEEMHSADFSTNWLENIEYLQIGALGWSSDSGESGFKDVFGGTVSDVIIVEGSYTPVALNKVLTEVESPLPADTPPLPEDKDNGASVVFEQSWEVTFDGKSGSIMNLNHDDKFELQEGTIAFTFNADDLNGRQGLVSKDATYYSGGGNHVSAMLDNDRFFIRFQDTDSDETFIFNNVKAGQDYDVQTWFGDGEVGLAINGQLVGVKNIDIDLSQNEQNLQFGGLGWSSADGSEATSNAFDGTMSNLLILDTALSLSNDDLFG